MNAIKADPLCKIHLKEKLLIHDLMQYTVPTETFLIFCMHIIFSSIFFSAARFSMSLIDGINQSEARRRALIFFCLTYLNKNVTVGV